jgi:uncharacterized protein (DUF2062 family)
VSLVRRTFRVLLHVEGTPHRIALAFGIGVFIAFFPIVGIHTAMALGIALAFRLSRVAILAGTFVNNPWTIAPLFMAGTAFGCGLLGVSTAELGGIDWGLRGWAFYASLLEHLRPLLLPYLLGNTLLGIASGSVGYFLLRSFLERRRPLSTVG